MKGCESITFSDGELSIEQFSRCETSVARNQHGITTATTRCIHFFVLQIWSCAYFDFDKDYGARSFVECGGFGGDLCLMLPAPRTLVFITQQLNEISMKLNRLSLSLVIASASIFTLAACSSSSDSDDAGSEVVLFDEATDGDIVDDPNNPQFLQLLVGGNRINAAMVAPDLDYLTINVPAGSELTAIELAEYVSSDDLSFIAIQNGSVFTELPASPVVGNLLGYLHFGISMEGTDILPAVALGEGAQGFTTPLQAGDYSLWIQETGPETVNYSLSFVVETVSQ